MPLELGDLRLYMGPQELGGPDDLESPIVEFIEQAQKKLDVAIQELESEPIARALVNAAHNGVSVRLVLEGDYLIEREDLDDVFVQCGKKEQNRSMLNALHRAGINAKLDYNPRIFHQKFMVRDRSAVLTGSTNFTPTGTQKNLNHLVTVQDQKVAREYASEFREIWSGAFGKRHFKSRKAPKEVDVSGVRVKVLFAPDHSPEMEIMKQMLKARERIDFAIFTFSKSSGIDDAMIALRLGGIPIRGVFDAGQGNQYWAASKGLAESGAEVYLARKGRGWSPGRLGKLHHKLMVIDDSVIIAGSFNYTKPANTLNDENIIIIGDLAEGRAASRDAQASLCRYARKEIDRIIDKHGHKLTGG
ncbi:MAG: phospholipase D-like domain-containing protein [Chromatiales bacterium]|nr:phospholipase [Gammaproteobacteria bacterium]